MKKIYETVSFKLLTILLIMIVVLTTIHLFFQYLNINLLREEFGPIFELTNRLDFDDEVSIGTWITQFLYLLLSSLCFLAWYVSHNKKQKRLWLVVASGALLGSIDEVAGLHELILQSIHNVYFINQAPTALANAWWIVLPVIIMFSSLLIYYMKQVFDVITVTAFTIGIIIFLSGAVLVDVLTSFIVTTPFTSQGIFVAIEESLELIGLSLFIYAVAQFIEHNHNKQLRRAINQLKP